MSAGIKRYCLGFGYFVDRVVLIEKKRPAWQKGFLNGLGGEIEGNETPQQAMTREFIEETGINVRQEQWHFVGMLNDPTLVGAEVHIFYGDLSALQLLSISAQIPHQRTRALIDKEFEVIQIVNYQQDGLKLHNSKAFMHNILDLILETSEIYQTHAVGKVMNEIVYTDPHQHVFKSWITKP